MKSVGEVMGIGRSFQEALHKATQSLEIKRNGEKLKYKRDTEKGKIILNEAQKKYDKYLSHILEKKKEIEQNEIKDVLGVMNNEK